MVSLLEIIIITNNYNDRVLKLASIIKPKVRNYNALQNQAYYILYSKLLAIVLNHTEQHSTIVRT